MIIITDLDGTLAHAAWRHNLKGDWDAYHAASKDDKPNTPMIAFINALATTMRVVCITTRPERWRQLTHQWLYKHRVHVDELIMRPEDDFRPSPAVKAEQVKQLRSDGPIIAIDDRADVIKAYADAGFTTLQMQES
jgi:hypothetical protein